jgi:hypothetical protein
MPPFSDMGRFDLRHGYTVLWLACSGNAGEIAENISDAEAYKPPSSSTTNHLKLRCRLLPLLI